MTAASWGSYSLSGAMLASGAAGLLAVASIRLDRASLLRAGRWMLWANLALLTLAIALLSGALLGDDFRLAYVAGYSERAQPLAYKLSALWAGQEGSLLLWAWLLAVASAWAGSLARRSAAGRQAVMLCVLAIVGTFFASVMIFAADPFRLLPAAPPDGSGMNPLLQDPAMVFHPPLLFAGYAVFVVPLALLLGGLVGGHDTGRQVKADGPRGSRGGLGPLASACIVSPDNAELLAGVRRWTLAGWVLLGVGVVLGAKWAYVELGWGGYWSWDPVENTSLTPWLTATALLHGLLAQRRRGVLKRLNALLVVATFWLCIFGTYVTRSGVLSSVHTFPESPVGWCFLGFLGAGLAACLAVVLWRWKALKPDRSIERLLSREGALLAGACLLVLMTVTVLVGTMWPVLSRPFTEHPMTLGPAFFNRVVLPMALALLGVMSVGPLMGSGAARRLGPLVAVLLAGAAAASVSALLAGAKPWVMASAGVGAMAVTGIVADLAGRARLAVVNSSVGAARGLFRWLAGDRRRVGAQLAHLGMVLILAGVAGSSLFDRSEDWHSSPGQTLRIGSHQVQFNGLEEKRDPGANYSAVEADLTALTGGQRETLRPQRRSYGQGERSNTEVAIRSTLAEDLYVSLVGWQDGGRTANLKVAVKPLVAWIWIGGIVLTVGGAVCLRERKRGHSTFSPRGAIAMPDRPVSEGQSSRNGRG